MINDKPRAERKAGVRVAKKYYGVESRLRKAGVPLVAEVSANVEESRVMSEKR